MKVPRFGWVALAAFVSACDAAAASEGDPLQGVIEYEDRVLAFEVGGRVQSIAVQRGDAVEAGATLIALDDGLEQPIHAARLAEVSAAKAALRMIQSGARPEEINAVGAQLRAVRAQQRIARQALERQAGLVEEGVIAPAALDQINGQVMTLAGQGQSLASQVSLLRHGARTEEIEAATARVDASTAALALVEARLARYTLRAVVEGDVVDVHVQTGEVIGPGAPAVTLADLDHPYVDIFVPEGRMAGVRVGGSARVRVDGVHEELRGRVEHIFPRTEFTPRFLFSEEERPNLVLRVRVRFDDPRRRVHAGLPAFVTLDGGRSGSTR